MTARVRFLAQLVVASALLISLAASPAAAQAPPPAIGLSAAQNTFLGGTFATVVQGREVWITTFGGARMKTRVMALAPTGVNVSDQNGQIRTIKFEDISMMQKALHRVRTHTLIGLGIGGVLGSFGLWACDGDGSCAGIVAVYAGIGAGIGALNGAIQNSRSKDDDLLYVAGIRTTTTKTIAPILTKARKGVAYVVSWR